MGWIKIMKTTLGLRRIWILTVLALGLGAGIGFWAGRYGPGSGGLAAREPAGTSLVQGSAAGAFGGRDQKSPPGPGGGTEGSLKIPYGDRTTTTLRQILAIPDTLKRLATLRAWCGELPAKEILAVVQEFKNMVEAQERIGELESMGLLFQSMDIISQAMMDKGVGLAMETFLGSKDEGDDKELAEGMGSMVFAKWALKDPAAARAFLEGRLADPEKITSVDKELTKELMRAWVQTDPDKAMEWLLKQPKELLEHAISPAFQALSHHNPDKAMELVAAQADLPGRDEIAAVMAQWWAKTTPDKALEWAQGLPETLAGPSVRRALGSWAEKDFAGAKKAMDGLSAPMKQEALPVLVEYWDEGEWSGAASFLDQQASGKGKQEAMGKLIGQWADADQQAASQWLAKQTIGPERDAGAMALADEVRDTDPEAAALWGVTLGDAGARATSLRETLKAWYGKSVPEALRWLESASTITDSERAALLEQAPAK